MVYTSLFLTGLISLVLLIYHWGENKGVIYLVILLLSTSARQLVFLLVNIQTDTSLLALLFLHLDALFCLIGPAGLYYFQSLLKGRLVLDWTLLLHLIPAMVILLNTLPYYGVPFAEKLQFVAQVQADNPSRENNFPYLLFHYHWQKLFLPAYNILYVFASFAYAIRVRQKGKLYVKRKVWFLLTRVMWVLLISIVPIVLLALYSAFAIPEKFTTSFVSDTFRSNRFFYLFTLILPVSILLMPRVLYGENQKDSPLERFWAWIKQFFAKRYPDKTQRSRESEDMQRIVAYLEKGKPYLKEDFSQHDISIALNIPQKRITECFNKQLKASFPLYRNTLRIQHATDLLREGAHLSTSIEGIATLSGFKSKSAFYLAFKAVHGITPVDWIKENL
jgi:AraC-like DNA-binding protein